jgi:hypothetical protein
MSEKRYPYSDNYPPQFLDIALCGEKTKTGLLCKAPAMTNGKCHWHGGRNRGAPRGNKNAVKHGYYTAEAIKARRRERELVKLSTFFKRVSGLI